MNERSIFLEALETPGPVQRVRYLDAVCGADVGLRARVEKLLAAHEAAGGILDQPALPQVSTGPYRPSIESPGTVIGAYKLLQQIGEGGFGVVFMAEQQAPIRRMVALKIIKPGMDTAEVIARFESERQALALMDHPNIAKVLDAGATESGRPYFVMELVKGVPITEFCDKNHLPPESRLKLFIDVCHAVQHAHHKGVIHRDIKPSNVMATLHDGVPVVKVIDFGVAKATVQKLTEKTLFTAYGQMIGTPAYMSPEQAEMSGLDIDTRSDVYSLGVLLYELLTGTTPLESKRLREVGYAEMQRLIREEEAPRPSNRLSSLGDSATVFAGNRGLDVKRLVLLLAGDLDWVVMKALEKDRNRRYGTPGNFAEDIERYLRREAILARPPSTAYKLKKFAQRNRAAVLTAAAIFIVLVAGIIGTTWGMLLADRQRGIAVAKKEEALAAATEEKQAHQRETEERKRAVKAQRSAADALRAMTDEVIERLIGAQPALGPNERAFLENTLKRWQLFAAELGDTPDSREIRAEGMFRVASIQEMLGARSEALDGYRESIRLSRAHTAEFPNEPRYRHQLSAGHSRLGILLKDLGKRLEAEAELQVACQIADKLAAEFPKVKAYCFSQATAHSDLGRLFGLMGKLREAEAELRLALDIEERLVPEFQSESTLRRSVAFNRSALGNVLRDQRKHSKAESELRRALAILQELSAEFPTEPKNQRHLASTHNMLGIVLAEQGKRSAAEASYRAALAIRERLAAQFQAVAAYRVEAGESLGNLGKFLMGTGKPAESLEWYGRSIDVLSPLVEQEPELDQARANLYNAHLGRALALNQLGRFTEALRDWDKAIALAPRAEQPALRAGRSGSLIQAGRLAEAIAEIQDLTGADNWRASDWYNFACAYSLASGKDASKREVYAVRAVELLQRAISKGWTDAEHIKRDTDLDALRARKDFKKLLAELEAGSTKKQEETKPPGKAGQF